MNDDADEKPGCSTGGLLLWLVLIVGYWLGLREGLWEGFW